MREIYTEIINMPHHQSETRTHMSRRDRAAQFAPFAALTGYEDAVEETARLTDGEIDLDENYLQELNGKMNKLRGKLKNYPKVKITYFVPDRLKDGGAYLTINGRIKKIDDNRREISMNDGTIIPLDSVIDIQAEESREQL